MIKFLTFFFQTLDTLSIGSGEHWIPQEDGHEDDDDDCGPRSKNYDQYPLLVEAAKRRNVSIHATCDLFNAIRADDKEIDKSRYISYEKVRQMSKRYGIELENEHEEITGYEHVGYDGKKSNILEEHNQRHVVDKQTFSCQSRRTYIDHKIPEDGTGKSLATAIKEVLDKYASTKTIKSISSDGTPVNTGLDNGANRILEELLDMPLQWLVCDLHHNELLFRHLFCKIGKQKNILREKLDDFETEN